MSLFAYRSLRFIFAFALFAVLTAHATNLKWDGGGNGVNFSDPLNWEGDVAPAAGSDSYRLEFNGAANGKSLVNDIVGLSVTNVTFGSNATSPVTISGEALTNCVTILTQSTTPVHHIFNCEVVCKSGVTPYISNGSGNYVKFIGGLKTYSLAFPANLSSDSAYYMGNIEVLTTDYLWNGTKKANGQKTINTLTTRVIIVSGSNVRIPNACLNWVQIENGATVTVNNLTTSDRFYGDNNSNRYMQDYKSWYAYWTRAADACNGTLRVLNGLSFAGKDCFMPDASSADSIVIMKGIKNSSTQTMPSSGYRGAPYVYLNQGNRVPKSGNAYGTTTHTGAGRIILGSGGLQVVSGANSNAKFVVGYDSTLGSYEDWAIAAHPTSGNAALRIESSKTLTIDTDHYAVGDPAIDDGATAHTVTVNGVIGGAGNLRIVGGGEVAFNSVCTHSGWTRVENGVAIIKSGARPAGGTFSVWGNGTMERKDRGTVTLGGGLIIGDNSTLRFTINDNTDTNKLVASYVSNTIETDDKYVNVYVKLGENLDYASLTNVYTLVTVTGDTKLPEEDLSKYKLIDNAHLTLAIDEGGNLVVKRKPFFYIKIAEQEDSQLEVPWNWLKENGVVATEEAIESGMLGKNGIPAWQSYCLGLEPTNSQSVVLCDAAPTQTDGGKVDIVAKNLNVREGLSGVVAVTAYLEQKSPDGWDQIGDGKTVSPGESIAFTTPEIGDGISFFV